MLQLYMLLFSYNPAAQIQYNCSEKSSVISEVTLVFFMPFSASLYKRPSPTITQVGVWLSDMSCQCTKSHKIQKSNLVGSSCFCTHSSGSQTKFLSSRYHDINLNSVLKLCVGAHDAPKVGFNLVICGEMTFSSISPLVLIKCVTTTFLGTFSLPARLQPWHLFHYSSKVSREIETFHFLDYASTLSNYSQEMSMPEEIFWRL